MPDQASHEFAGREAAEALAAALLGLDDGEPPHLLVVGRAASPLEVTRVLYAPTTHALLLLTDASSVAFPLDERVDGSWLDRRVRDGLHRRYVDGTYARPDPLRDVWVARRPDTVDRP